jgi:hypothetical protein
MSVGSRPLPPYSGIVLFVLTILGIIMVVGPLPVAADYAGAVLCAGAAIVVVTAALLGLRRKR